MPYQTRLYWTVTAMKTVSGMRLSSMKRAWKLKKHWNYEEEEKIECQNAYKFLSTVLADFLPSKLKMEEYSVMSGDNEGYFFHALMRIPMTIITFFCDTQSSDSPN